MFFFSFRDHWTIFLFLFLLLFFLVTTSIAAQEVGFHFLFENILVLSFYVVAVQSVPSAHWFFSQSLKDSATFSQIQYESPMQQYLEGVINFPPVLWRSFWDFLLNRGSGSNYISKSLGWYKSGLSLESVDRAFFRCRVYKESRWISKRKWSFLLHFYDCNLLDGLYDLQCFGVK